MDKQEENNILEHTVYIIERIIKQYHKRILLEKVILLLVIIIDSIYLHFILEYGKIRPGCEWEMRFKL